jgi:hypothetical protein
MLQSDAFGDTDRGFCDPLEDPVDVLLSSEVSKSEQAFW